MPQLQHKPRKHKNKSKCQRLRLLRCNVHTENHIYSVHAQTIWDGWYSGLSRLCRGNLRSLRGGHVRGEDPNLSVIGLLMFIMSMISIIWSTDNHLTNRKIFFFNCMPRPIVVYIGLIVIYRQPCALHISWYTVHRTSGGIHCARSGDTIVFRGWIFPPLRNGYQDLIKVWNTSRPPALNEAPSSERRRRDHRGAEEGGAWEGVSPSPLGVGSGEGAVPPPQKIFGLFILK